MLPLTSWIIDEIDRTAMLKSYFCLRFLRKGYIKKWGSNSGCHSFSLERSLYKTGHNT